MKITKQDVEHIAKLARIEFSEEEKEKFTAQLDKILSYVAKLNELDTAKAEPMAHVLPLQNVLREDEVTNDPPSQEVFKIAPQFDGGLYKVPPVIE